MAVFGRVTLARLSAPSDTSRLAPCGKDDAARAIAVMSARLGARRAVLAAKGVSGPTLERVLGSLRRLRNPRLAAYHSSGGVLLSEPFGMRPSVVERAPIDSARHFVAALVRRAPPPALVEALAPFGVAALQKAVDAGIRIAMVPAGRAFSQCSHSVASLVPDIDQWAAPPAGLFVLEERLVLLRNSALRMAAAHEFAHALDAVLATRPRSYYSFETVAIRKAFGNANGFVNEYAGSGLDEYFAECLRAYVEVNDDRSQWLPLTRHDLAVCDSAMYAIVEELFTRIAVA